MAANVGTAKVEAGEESMAGEEEMAVEENDGSDDSSNEENEHEVKIAELEKQVTENPYLYQSHVDLIQLLRKAGEFERLREARQRMSHLFPLTGELWLEWTEDEIRMADEDDEVARDRISALFEQAVKDYVSVAVWLEYIQFSIGGMGREGGIDAVRTVCERALTAAGLHVSAGATLWEAYREFENAILMGLQPAPGSVVSASQQEQLDAQTKRIIGLFKRQLALPLNDMEATFDEFREFASEGEVEKIVPLYQKALNKLEKLRPFENNLLGDDGDKLTAYEAYIQHEQSGNDPARIQCIFERAVHNHCLVPQLWLQYTKYLDRELQIPDVVLSVYERSIRNCPWSSELWLGYGRAMERFCRQHEKVKDVFTKGLSVGFSTGSDYLGLWTAYCDYLRRCIDWKGDHAAEWTELKTIFDQAIQHLTDAFPHDGDPNCTLLQYWARLEAKCAGNMEKARELWNQVLQLGHGSEAAMWLEYFNLERAYGNHKHARKILQRAINSANDWPETVCEAYIRFEREEGDSIDAYDIAIERCEAQMKRIEERRAKAAEKEAALTEQKKQNRKDKRAAKKGPGKETNQGAAPRETPAGKHNQGQGQGQISAKIGNLKGQLFVRGQQQSLDGQKSAAVIETDVRPYKRKHPEAQDPEAQHPEAQHPEAQHPEAQHPEAPAEEAEFKVPASLPAKPSPPLPVSRAPPPGYKGPPKGARGPPPPGYKPAPGPEQPPEKKVKVDEDDTGQGPAEDHAHTVKPSKETCTAFVSNLDFSVDEDRLQEFFSKIGEVTEVRLIKKPGGKSKGFAYIEFKDEFPVTEAVKLDRSLLDGRPMFISRCNERANNASSFKYATQMEKNKLFVRGLPFSCTEEELTKIFLEHGKLKQVRLVTYRSGASKGLAYVEFERESDASQAVLKMDGHEMDGHTISVAISNPPQRKAPAAAPAFTPTLGGGKKDFGIRGKAHTQLSLVPRSLQKKPKPAIPSTRQSSTPADSGGKDDCTTTSGNMSNEDFRQMLLKR